jgi:uncharacterized membrane protein affecting hemolysin expression
VAVVAVKPSKVQHHRAVQVVVVVAMLVVLELRIKVTQAAHQTTSAVAQVAVVLVLSVAQTVPP